MQPHYTPSLEYIAGYFDGEGCITMRIRPGNDSCRLAVQVQTANLPILEILRSRFGGWIGPNKHVDKRLINTTKQRYHWQLSGIQECHDFLYSIQPFAIEKRSQIDTALIWLEYRLAFPVRGPSDYDRTLAYKTHALLKQLKLASQ